MRRILPGKSLVWSERSTRPAILTTVAGGGTLSRRWSGCKRESSLVALALTLDAAAIFTVADRQTSSVRKVDSAGDCDDHRGQRGRPGFGGDNGPCTPGRGLPFNEFSSARTGCQWEYYVGDEGNGRVRRIDTAGIVPTVGWKTALPIFRAMAVRQPAQRCICPLAWRRIILETILRHGTELRQNSARIAPDHTISVYAGNGTSGYSGDGGPATGRIVIGTRRVWQVGPDDSTDRGRYPRIVWCGVSIRTGVISTIAGTGKCGYGGDGGPATPSRLERTPPVWRSMTSGNLAITEAPGNKNPHCSEWHHPHLWPAMERRAITGDGGDSLKARVVISQWNSPLQQLPVFLRHIQ